MPKAVLKSDLLAGSWRSPNEWESEVVYRVSKSKNTYSVLVCDTSDGELADVFELKWDEVARVLSFATYWNSSGRFLRCRLFATSKNQVELTYTYTATTVLVRGEDKT